jgi:hypothetical protein
MSRPCRCGHSKHAHMHYRAGTECAPCPPGVCKRYRRSWLKVRTA